MYKFPLIDIIFSLYITTTYSLVTKWIKTCFIIILCLYDKVNYYVFLFTPDLHLKK